ncbi:MAG: SDR family oxidoreductase [Candidatus Eremiobacteraeota bacterium]|nr:SDR family oxidoreductase [Candidatus Eremiobacteraeota bacterium]
MLAIITGASGGFGHGFAHKCAEAGIDCVLVARSEQRLHDLAATLRDRYNVKADVVVLDLGVPGAARELFACVPSCDVLINNAGFASSGAFDKVEEQRLLEEIQVDVATLTHLTHLYLPGMLARKNGRILNVASTAAFLPGPFMAVYYACKAYVLSFSQALSEEMRGKSVTVTCLAPGATAGTGFEVRANVAKTRLFRIQRRNTVESVVNAGFDGMMKGKDLVVPGLMNKLAAISPRVTPRRLLIRMSRKLIES